MFDLLKKALGPSTVIAGSILAATYYAYTYFLKDKNESIIPNCSHSVPSHPQTDKTSVPCGDIASWSREDLEQLVKDFKVCVDFMATPHAKKYKFSTSDKLRLYGLYKVATVGVCNTPAPSAFDIQGSAKWNAWRELQDSQPLEAMLSYIQLVTKLCPDWMMFSVPIEDEVSYPEEEEVLEYDPDYDKKKHDRLMQTNLENEKKAKDELKAKLLTGETTSSLNTVSANTASSPSEETMGPVFSKVDINITKDEEEALKAKLAKKNVTTSSEPISIEQIEDSTEATQESDNNSTSDTSNIVSPRTIVVEDNMHAFAGLQDLEVLDDFLKRYPDVVCVDELGTSLLHFVADSGSPAMIDRIMAANYGYDINMRDGNEQTPLMLAVCAENVECVSKLIDLGADISITDDDGEDIMTLMRDIDPDVADVIHKLLDEKNITSV